MSVLAPNRSRPTVVHNELFEILKEKSFFRGDFILASGKRASWYLDCRRTALSGRASLLIGEIFCRYLFDQKPVDAVGGMVLGAAPLVTAVTVQSAAMGNPMEGFLVRKEAKGHGRGNQIEGNIEPWMRVAMVEDVVTTGNSTRRAIEMVKQHHPSIEVVQVLSLVDRGEGGVETFKSMGIPYHYLYSADEFLKG